MDGVGGSVKRNADQHILHGMDITCAKDLVGVFVNSKTKVLEIPAQSVANMKKTEPKILNPLKGIMGIRQITWDKGGGMNGRELSCFLCPTETNCKHHHSMPIPLTNHEVNIETRKKKIILKISDVYTTDESSEDDKPTKTMPFSPFENEDIKNGTFIAVSLPFDKSGSTKTFLAIAQSSIDDDSDVNVMYLKAVASDPTMFYADENDISYITSFEILGTTPTPDM